MSWLGVLDISSSIASMVELAPLAEQLGFARYWIAEHQPQPSPVLLAALVAGQTERIRVGTAGVLLHYYPPARTALDFLLLETAFAKRIDVGFCGGVTPLDALVELDRDGRDLAAVMAAYPARAARFVAQLRNTRASPQFDPSLAWHEACDEPPEIWSLGGGARSAELAATLGVGFGYGLMFHASVDDPAAVAHYRTRFAPHPGCPAPKVIVAVAGVCAQTDAEAQAIAARRHAFFAPRIVGSPRTCGAALEALRARYRADEIVFADLCPTLEARMRGYRLLAEAC